MKNYFSEEEKRHGGKMKISNSLNFSRRAICPEGLPTCVALWSWKSAVFCSGSTKTLIWWKFTILYIGKFINAICGPVVCTKKIWISIHICMLKMCQLRKKGFSEFISLSLNISHIFWSENSHLYSFQPICDHDVFRNLFGLYIFTDLSRSLLVFKRSMYIHRTANIGVVVIIGWTKTNVATAEGWRDDNIHVVVRSQTTHVNVANGNGNWEDHYCRPPLQHRHCCRCPSPTTGEDFTPE